MLVLYETALGFCRFKLTDAAKLESADLWEEFESPEKANKLYVCVRALRSVGSELNFLFAAGVFAYFKAEVSRLTSVHVYRDGRRGNHRHPGRENRKGSEKILVGRDVGEREGQAIPLRCG